MKVKLKNLQLAEDVQSQYWLYPSLMSLISIALLIIALFIDHFLNQSYLFNHYKIFNFDYQGVREILSTIITTSITITSVTFSITILTLSLASSQLGPRLLPNFIRQGSTQFALGIFVSVYIYCLMLIIITSNEHFNGKPFFVSLSLGITLAIFAFFTLIYFIHFVCNAIQIDQVLGSISKQVQSAVQRQPKSTELSSATSEKPQEYHAIYAQKNGYIQTIDLVDIKDLAASEDITIEILKRPGHFIFKGMKVANIYAHQGLSPTLSNNINNLIKTGRKRTTIQDIEYGFEQIVEIALRALSPGINNPFTAINCIQVQSELLSYIATYYKPTGYIADNKNRICVLFKISNYSDIVNICFNQIRENSQAHVGVNIELLKSINYLLDTPIPKTMANALIKQRNLIVESCKKQSFNPEDLKDILSFADTESSL